MSFLSKQFLDTAKTIVLATILVLGVQYVFAWQGPPAGAPPDNCVSGQPGCDPPVNVGGTYQAKIGNGIGADWFGAFSMKVIDDSAHEDILLVADVGITVSDGDITVSNGAVKGASLENLGGTGVIDSSGNVKGASFSVGSNEVISSSKVGTFSGGVKVGDDIFSTINYFQLDTYSGSADCSQLSHLGRMYFRPNNHTIFVCDIVGDSPQWQGIILEPPPA